jgi:hypothetical protein
MITQALGTLPFIATLSFLIILGASMLRESRGKIFQALKGTSAMQLSPAAPCRRVRITLRTTAAKSARRPLRAAA